LAVWGFSTRRLWGESKSKQGVQIKPRGRRNGGKNAEGQCKKEVNCRKGRIHKEKGRGQIGVGGKMTLVPKKKRKEGRSRSFCQKKKRKKVANGRRERKGSNWRGTVTIKSNERTRGEAREGGVAGGGKETRKNGRRGIEPPFGRSRLKLEVSLKEEGRSASLRRKGNTPRSLENRFRGGEKTSLGRSCYWGGKRSRERNINQNRKQLSVRQFAGLRNERRNGEKKGQPK